MYNRLSLAKFHHIPYFWDGINAWLIHSIPYQAVGNHLANNSKYCIKLTVANVMKSGQTRLDSHHAVSSIWLIANIKSHLLPISFIFEFMFKSPTSVSFFLFFFFNCQKPTYLERLIGSYCLFFSGK